MVPWNVTGDDVFAFVQRLRSHLKQPLLLIWDRFSGHKKAARLLRDIYGYRIHVEFLPAYAPELNVVDHAWGHTKYGEMANFIPHDVDDSGPRSRPFADRQTSSTRPAQRFFPTCSLGVVRRAIYGLKDQ